MSASLIGVLGTIDNAHLSPGLLRRICGGDFTCGCVARQYVSRNSAKCSHASSNWFSSKIRSNISCRRCVRCRSLQKNHACLPAGIVPISPHPPFARSYCAPAPFHASAQKASYTITVHRSYLDETLKHFRRANLDVDNNRRKTGLNELTRLIDSVTVEHDQLHATRQLEYTLDLRLYCTYLL